MASFLQAIFPCCTRRARRNDNRSSRTHPDERTPLIGDAQAEEDHAAAAREQRPKSLLPQLSYDAEAMRAIVKDVHTKLIPLDAPDLFNSTAAYSKSSAASQQSAADGKGKTRPLTLVRNLKLHIAQEAALEDHLQREGKGRAPQTSTNTGASNSTSDLARNGGGGGGLRRKKTSGGENRFPSVHSLKTLARGGGSAFHIGGGGETSPTENESAAATATTTTTTAATHNTDEDDLAYHTAKEASHTMATKEATSRPKLVDIWGTSPPEKSKAAETYASRARKALRKESLQPVITSQSADGKEGKRMTTTQAAEIESTMFEKLADTLKRQGPLTEIWGGEHDEQ